MFVVKPDQVTRSGAREGDLSYDQARELSRIREQLRDRLRARDTSDVDALLDRMSAVLPDDPSLAGERVRWRLRFDLVERAAAQHG